MKRDMVSVRESLKSLEERSIPLLQHVIRDVASYQDDEELAENSKREELIVDNDPERRERFLQTKLILLKSQLQSLHDRIRRKEIKYLQIHADITEEIEEMLDLQCLEKETESWYELLDMRTRCTKICKQHWNDLLEAAKVKLAQKEQERSLLQEELEEISLRIRSDERLTFLRGIKKNTLRKNVRQFEKKIASMIAEIVHEDNYLQRLHDEFGRMLNLVTEQFETWSEERFEPELLELKHRRDVLREEERRAELLLRSTALRCSMIEKDIDRLQSEEVDESLTAQEAEDHLSELIDRMLDLDLESRDCDEVMSSILRESQRKIDAVYVDLWLLTQQNAAVAPVVQRLLRKHLLQPLPREFPATLLPPLPTTDEDKGWPSSPESTEDASLPLTPPSPLILPSTPCLTCVEFSENNVLLQQDQTPLSVMLNSQKSDSQITLSTNPYRENNLTTPSVLNKQTSSSSSHSCLKKTLETESPSSLANLTSCLKNSDSTPPSLYSTPSCVPCLKTPTETTSTSTYLTPCLKTPSLKTRNSTPCLKRKVTKSPPSTSSTPTLKILKSLKTPLTSPSTPETHPLNKSGVQSLTSSVSPRLKTSMSLKRRLKTSRLPSTDSSD